MEKKRTHNNIQGTKKTNKSLVVNLFLFSPTPIIKLFTRFISFTRVKQTTSNQRTIEKEKKRTYNNIQATKQGTNSEVNLFLFPPTPEIKSFIRNASFTRTKQTTIIKELWEKDKKRRTYKPQSKIKVIRGVVFTSSSVSLSLKSHCRSSQPIKQSNKLWGYNQTRVLEQPS